MHTDSCTGRNTDPCTSLHDTLIPIGILRYRAHCQLPEHIFLAENGAKRYTKAPDQGQLVHTLTGSHNEPAARTVRSPGLRMQETEKGRIYGGLE